MIPLPSVNSTETKSAHLCFPALILLLLVRAAAGQPEGVITYDAADTLNPHEEASQDARQCLEFFVWTPTRFQVECEPTPAADYDWLVRYPTPVQSGDAANDRVVLEWYEARRDGKDSPPAPAVVVVHESGRDMIAGKLFARSLRAKGIHAFMIQLPTYGGRRPAKSSRSNDVVQLFRQGVADIRRARDAVAVIPQIDARMIGLQGTSLGGFAASLAASLDAAYDRTFLVLAGGQLYQLVREGRHDTARFRDQLIARGYTLEKLEPLFWQIEPTRIAHRLNPGTTWLYSAANDQVVPAKYSQALASSAYLKETHHLHFPGSHYTVFLYFPKLLDHIVAQMQATGNTSGEFPAGGE